MVVSALGVDISLPVFGSGRVGTGHQDTRQGGHQGIEIHTRPPPPQPRGAQPSAGGTDPPLQFLVQHNNHDTEEHNVHIHACTITTMPAQQNHGTVEHSVHNHASTITAMPAQQPRHRGAQCAQPYHTNTITAMQNTEQSNANSKTTTTNKEQNHSTAKEFFYCGL